jgi:aminoglycoside phosphotransferase (APT) family kinase protein
LLVRGERVDSELVFPLDHEMRFQDVAHCQGAPMPKVFGWIDEARCFVMERLPGRADFAGITDEERDRLVDQYLVALAGLHSLDIRPFAEAGISRAACPVESGNVGMRRFEAVYRHQKELPDPFLEWALGWLRRHPPRSHGRESPVVWDSGQFHHADGHLVGFVDLEMGHVGDPMMDLAGWRMRDSIMGFGSFAALYDRYSELVGEPVDLEAIQLHHIFFTLTNSLAVSHAVKRPPEGSDHATNMQWCNETNIFATESIAEYLGADLPDVAALGPLRRDRCGR